MTKRQFNRLSDFAVRMTRVAIGNPRWQAVLRRHVKDILWQMDGGDLNYREIIAWDDNHEASESERRRSLLPYTSELLCDYVSTYCWDHNLTRERETARGDCSPIHSKLDIALHCCLRAACDLAAQPSAGVAGFTVGDLRKMWPGQRIPKWVAAEFEPPIAQAKDTDSIWL